MHSESSAPLSAMRSIAEGLGDSTCIEIFLEFIGWILGEFVFFQGKLLSSHAAWMIPSSSLAMQRSTVEYNLECKHIRHLSRFCFHCSLLAERWSSFSGEAPRLPQQTISSAQLRLFTANPRYLISRSSIDNDFSSSSESWIPLVLSTRALRKCRDILTGSPLCS